MTKVEIIELVALSMIAVASLIGIIIYYVKKGQLKKLYNDVVDSINEAEATSGLTGPEKKELAMKRMQEKCKEMHLPFALLNFSISKLIEKIIKAFNSLSKK